MPPPEKFSRAEVESVLRRAAEIDTARGTAADDEQARGEGALGETDLVRLGEEAGLGPEALRQAVAEMRRGALTITPDGGAIASTLGPGTIVVSRQVPGPPQPVQRAVERFLRDQLMTVRRHHGERVEWERAQGLFPGLVRSLDFARRYAFGPVSRVQTLVVPDGDDATSVTFHIDLHEMRRHRMFRWALRASSTFVLVGLGGAALLPGFGLADILALTVGGAAAGGMFALERQRFETGRQQVALAPERFLDLLVQRRLRAVRDPGGPDEG